MGTQGVPRQCPEALAGADLCVETWDMRKDLPGEEESEGVRVEIASAKGLEMRMQEAGWTVPSVVVSGQSGARPERFSEKHCLAACGEQMERGRVDVERAVRR